MSVCSHEKAIQQGCINVLLTKAYSYVCLDGLSQEFINAAFYLRQNHYNVNILNVFTTDNPRENFLLSSTVNRANLLWKTLSPEVKDCSITITS